MRAKSQKLQQRIATLETLSDRREKQMKRLLKRLFAVGGLGSLDGSSGVPPNRRFGRLLQQEDPFSLPLGELLFCWCCCRVFTSFLVVSETADQFLEVL